MLNIMSAVLVAMVVVPALMAAVAFGTGQRWPRLIGRLGAAVAGLGFAGAVGLAVLAGGGDPVAASAGPLDLEADRLAVVLLLLVFGVSAVVQTFALRYLAGDPRANWFVGGAGLLTAASAGLMTVSSLVGLAVFWTAAGMALCLLLGMYWHLPAARDGVRRTAFAFLVGDLALWSAVAVATVTRGPVDLRSIEPGQLSGGPAALLATLVVIAALSRSAQIPFHRWLPATLTAPTPVSALLHAGILNAGPFLAIRMAFVLDGSRSATTFLLLIGGVTAAFASVSLLTQPSVKVALAYSSAAHMGFMLMVCGMGLYPAALLHLVAHSFYKAHAFLSSGSVIDEQRASGVALPRRLGSPARILASFLVAVAIYAPLALVWGLDLGGRPVLIAVGGVLVLGTTQLIAPALDSNGPWLGAVRAAILALGVTLSFFVLEGGAHLLLGDVVPELTSRDGIQLALIGVVLAVFTAVVALQIIEPTRTASSRRLAIAVHMRNGLYANAIYDRLIGALRTNPTSSTIDDLVSPITHDLDQHPTSVPASPSSLEPTWN